jgi:DNA-binding winged helix-turn-helix (wHTH) protein/pSer/pThr/pTyr-binding forkhead associated (FHA) protein
LKNSSRFCENCSRRASLVYYAVKGSSKVKDVESTIRLEVEAPRYEDAKKPVLVILQGEPVGLTVEIEGDKTVIGRGAQSDVVLNDTVASRQHAEIYRRAAEGGDEYFIKDLMSTNGTYLNEMRLVAQERLRDGDKIKIGGHILKFALMDEVELRALHKSQSSMGDIKVKGATSEELLCFPPFHIPADVDLLYKDEEVVPLEPQAVRVLRYLAENHGRVVTKDELLEAVWPDVFTTDGVLKKAISQARRALSDDIKEARFIETYHRRGYRFIAPVHRRVKHYT